MSDIRVVDRPLVVIHTAWADALPLEKLGLLIWIAVHGPVSEDYLQEQFPGVELGELAELLPADLMAPPKRKQPKPRKERELTVHQRKMKHLVAFFSDKTDIPEPEPETAAQRRAAGFGWFSPLNQLLKLCGGDTRATTELVEDTIAYMRENGLTIADPNSLLKTANARHAEAKSDGIAF